MKVVVAGSTGLAGSAISAAFSAQGHQVIGLNRSVVDLLDGEATKRFLVSAKPDLVIDAAAKVGGIGANNTFPVEFLADNITIQGNLMSAAHAAGVENFVFLGSSCIYPRDCAQPIKEEYFDDRSARGHKLCICDRKDCRYRTNQFIPKGIWDSMDFVDAYKSLWAA